MLYLAIALALFYPITLNMGTAAPGSGAAPFQNLWNIWWVNYALFNLHTSVYFTNLLFWPVGASLVFQTMPPLTALLSAPFQAFGVVFAYNTIFMLGFAFSGIAMFVLADYLVRNRYAAFIAGLVFAFSAFHIAQSYSSLAFLYLGWVPIFLYFTLRVFREKRNYWNILGMSASFALATLMGSIEQSAMLIILLILLTLMYVLNKPTRSRIINRDFAVSMILFAIAAFIIGSWNFVPMMLALLRPGGSTAANLLNTAKYNAMWSSDALAFFVPSFYNGIFSSINSLPGVYRALYAGYDISERVAYLGFTVLALSLYGIFKDRKKTMPWLVLAVVFGWLTLGPYLQIAGSVTQIPGLYSLYHLMPLLNSIREPGRFNLMLTMMLAILSAFGVKALIEKFGHPNAKRMAAGIVVVLSILILIESNGMPLGNSAIASMSSTSIAPSHLYSELSNLTGNFSVLELPALDAQTSAMATYHTSITHQPLVGGYVTRENLTEELSLYNIPLAIQSSTLATSGAANFESPVNENFTNQTLLSLYNYNTAFVVVRKGAYNSTTLTELLTYLLKTFGNPVFNDNTTTAFSSTKAVNQSVFKSYVSYPIVTDWQQTAVPFNGTITRMWLPSNPGAIAVYAPFAATQQLQQTINTTISFVALAAKPSVLLIEAETASGAAKIASVNVSSSMRKYSVDTALISGPRGNVLFFVEGQTLPIYLSNITFSRR